MAILEAENVTKIYGNGETSVTALDNINISIEKGDFVAIMGSSGSGKSTFLHILGGLDEPTSGRIIVDEKDILEIEADSEDSFVSVNAMKDKMLSLYRREKIGFIFQEYNLIPILTLEENIELPIRLSNKKIDKIYIAELLELFELTNRKKHFPHQASGGQQQRAAIARALANKPSIILADEPTGNLDKKNGIAVLQYLKKCNTDLNQTIIMVTHDSEIASFANRIVKIEDGKIVCA